MRDEQTSKSCAVEDRQGQVLPICNQVSGDRAGQATKCDRRAALVGHRQAVQRVQKQREEGVEVWRCELADLWWVWMVGFDASTVAHTAPKLQCAGTDQSSRPRCGTARLLRRKSKAGVRIKKEWHKRETGTKQKPISWRVCVDRGGQMSPPKERTEEKQRRRNGRSVKLVWGRANRSCELAVDPPSISLEIKVSSYQRFPM